MEIALRRPKSNIQDLYGLGWALCRQYNKSTDVASMRGGPSSLLKTSAWITMSGRSVSCLAALRLVPQTIKLGNQWFCSWKGWKIKQKKKSGRLIPGVKTAARVVTWLAPEQELVVKPKRCSLQFNEGWLPSHRHCFNRKEKTRRTLRWLGSGARFKSSGIHSYEICELDVQNT